MKDWIINSSSKLEPRSRAKLYVAITRAKHIVAFVDDDIVAEELSNIHRWSLIWLTNIEKIESLREMIKREEVDEIYRNLYVKNYSLLQNKVL